MYMYTNCFVCDNFCFLEMGMELCQLDHQENCEYLYKILFFIFLGCQSVRDRTAQVGALIFKFNSIYTKYSLTGEWHTKMPDQVTLHKHKNWIGFHSIKLS